LDYSFNDEYKESSFFVIISFGMFSSKANTPESQEADGHQTGDFISSLL
jgi:hypothetical protein